MEAAERADVDDASMGGFEVRVRGLGGEERGTGIGFEHPVPLIDGDAFEGGGFEVAGVVDEDIETREAGGSGFDGGANLGGVAEFGTEGGGFDAKGFEAGNGLSGFGFRVAPGDGDGGAGFGEGQGEGSADAFCGAGHEGDFSL